MRWVITLLLGLGLGICIFCLLDSSTTPPPTSKETESEDTGYVEVGAAENGSPAKAGFDRSGQQGAVPTQREDGTPRDTTEPGPHVQVVRGANQQPVANARVFFFAENDSVLVNSRSRESSRTLFNSQTSKGKRWEGPELYGKQLRTDQFGKVQLPGGTGRMLCSAKKNGEFGFLALPARLGSHTITLQPDEQLLIVAKHPGSPERAAASIPVALIQTYKVNRTSRIWRGTTDERGHAVVRHLQLLRRDVPASVPEDFREQFAALALIPSAPAIVAEFDGRPLKQPSVLLTLPPQGSIVAKLIDHAGKALLSSARISFGSPPQTRKPGDMRISSSYLKTSASKPVGATNIELPYAQVGMQVQLSARYPHDRRQGQSKRTMGPTQVGQKVAVEIPPLARHTVFAGRFLHRNGSAFAAQKVDITIWRNDKVQTTASAEAIDDGQWDLVLTGRTEEARWRMEFRCQQVATDDEATNPWIGAIIELPPWPPGKRIELGDIVLGELPPLATGMVVDDRGNPVANASINIQQEQPQAKASGATRINLSQRDSGTVQLIFEGGNGRALRNTWFNNSRQQRWRSIRHLRTRTEADGTFRIDAPMPTGTLRIVADTNDHASQSLPLTRPSADLRIVIARNGVLTGRVLVPEWLPDGAISVSVRAHETTADKQSSTTTRIRNDSGGKFVLQPLRPGRYDVLVEMRNLKVPMASVMDVVVRPGTNKDPRLQLLDVRQSLFRYYLQAFDDAGQPFALDGPIHARFQQPDGSFVESGFRWQQGKAELITVHANAELTFFGRGFESLKQQYGPGKHDVILKKQRPAIVQIPGARGLSGPTRKVRISAILVGDTGLPSSLSGTDQMTGRNFSMARWDLGRSSGGWLEQTDVVEIPLMTAGNYRLMFRAHATLSTNTPQTSVTLGTFELRPDGTTRTNVLLNVTEITEALRANDKLWQDQLARNKKRGNR
jgi:hypothetical protein